MAKDIMVTGKKMPVINHNKNFKEALKVMNEKKLGILVILKNNFIKGSFYWILGGQKEEVKNRIEAEKILDFLEIKKLIKIHNSLAIGDVEVIHVDKDEYIMKREGNAENPGLILYISSGNSTLRRNVQTNWNNVTLLDYSGNSTYNPTSDENGMVTIEAPANGYSIYSITK